MNKLVIEINRNNTKKEINKLIDKLYDEIKKLSVKQEEKEKIIKSIQKSKLNLAKAYSREIGVILTQKEFDRTLEGKGRFASPKNSVGGKAE